MGPFLTEFRKTVRLASLALLEMSDQEASVRPAQDKWSPKEIIGHLIDSASNNHQRFVRAMFTDDLVFPGYQQNDWVKVQQYQEESWPSLVEFWARFNLHLLQVMSVVPEDIRTRPRPKHNLDEIAWKTVPKDQPATLDYFMRDYVDHLRHHLHQILPDDQIDFQDPTGL